MPIGLEAQRIFEAGKNMALNSKERPALKCWGDNPYSAVILATGSSRKQIMMLSLNAGEVLPDGEKGPLGVQDWFMEQLPNGNNGFDKSEYFETGEFEGNYEVPYGLSGSPLLALGSVEGMPFFGHITDGEGYENHNPEDQASNKAVFLRDWLVGSEGRVASSFPILIVGTDAVDRHIDKQGNPYYLGKPCNEPDYPKKLGERQNGIGSELRKSFDQRFLAKHFHKGKVITHVTGLAVVDTASNLRVVRGIKIDMAVEREIKDLPIRVDHEAGGGGVLQQLLLMGACGEPQLDLGDGLIISEPREILYHISGMPMASIVRETQEISLARGNQE